MKEKLLYFHNGKSTFVERDIDILNCQYEVIEFYFAVKNKKKIGVEFLKQLTFILKHLGVKKYVTQFGGFHSYLPSVCSKLLHKKHVIILSGTDCVSFPSIDYGNFNRKLLGYFTKKSMLKADLLLPVSQELVKYQYTYQPDDFPYQGYEFHVTGIQTPYQVIHYGYDISKWEIESQKEVNSFVTVVADLSTRFGMKLKGIDLILEVALLLPNCNFYIVGGKTINKTVTIPENVILLDLVPNTELKNILASKQFYLQLSMSEGFPNALCEAMLCKCVPIVSRVSSMPFIISDTGFVLDQKDKHLLKSEIEEAMTSNLFEKAQAAKQRIVSTFGIEKRKTALLRAVSQL